MSHRTTRRARRARTIPAALALTFLLAACSDDGTSINDQMRQGDQKGYVGGDGSVEQLPPQDRDTTIDLQGSTLEDEPWSSQDHLGEVVVVNVWGSWCAPCHAEAPDLVEVSQAYAEAGDPVQFVGVNTRDSVPNAQSFERRYDVPYESLLDDGGRTLAQLEGLATARPTTLVLDGEGRVAARVTGQVDASTLRGLIDDVLADEPAADAAGATG